MREYEIISPDTEHVPMTSSERTADVAFQVAWWARNLSATVEDSLGEWRSYGGHLSEDTISDMASHLRTLATWLSIYDEARMAEIG